MKNGFSLTYYTFKNIQKYQNFHPLIFYGYTRLRGVGADLLHPGCNRVKLQTSWKKNKYIFPVFNCKPKGLATLRRCVKLEKGVGLGLGHFQESEIVKSRAVAPPPLNINGDKKNLFGQKLPRNTKCTLTEVLLIKRVRILLWWSIMKSLFHSICLTSMLLLILRSQNNHNCGRDNQKYEV